jgi:TRAP-type uncharacterized transport system fused permease subunit
VGLVSSKWHVVSGAAFALAGILFGVAALTDLPLEVQRGYAQGLVRVSLVLAAVIAVVLGIATAA